MYNFNVVELQCSCTSAASENYVSKFFHDSFSVSLLLTSMEKLHFTEDFV